MSKSDAFFEFVLAGAMIALSTFFGEVYDRNLVEFNLVCGGLVETISEILGSTTCDDARIRLAILAIIQLIAAGLAVIFFLAGMVDLISGDEPSGDESSHRRDEGTSVQHVPHNISKEKTSNIHQEPKLTDSNVIKKGAKFCTGCGSKRKPSAKFCFNCGKEC